MANKLPKKFIRAIKAGKVKAHDDVDIKKLQKAIKELSKDTTKVIHRQYTVSSGTDEIYMVASRRENISG